MAEAEEQKESPQNLEMLYNVPVELSVELGSCMMPMKSVLELTPGKVVQLDKEADKPADLYVNDKLVAQGEVVVVDNCFGIKITKLF
ncbi:flagellar motor switch protein FliN [bacterium]|nr:flagellar motor switch protein FliN [bacterium]MDC0299557.1 flagellar motor switch protein FliN [Verrucomicrobiota bacterium]